MSEEAQNTADAGDNNTEQAPAPEATFSQQGGESGALLAQFGIGDFAAPVTHRKARRMQGEGAAKRFQGREGGFHGAAIVPLLGQERGTYHTGICLDETSLNNSNF